MGPGSRLCWSPENQQSAVCPSAAPAPRAAAPPSSDMNSRRSFNHLVGAGEQCRRYVEAEGLSSLKVNHKLVLSWGLYRKVGRVLALEDAIDIDRRLPVCLEHLNPVGHQAAACDEVSERIDRR